MPYIPCTDADRAAMLERIGAKSIEELFDAIPKKLRMANELDIAPGLSESEVMTYMSELGAKSHVFPAQRVLAGGGVRRVLHGREERFFLGPFAGHNGRVSQTIKGAEASFPGVLDS